MSDKFTLTFTYDRDEIYADVEKMLHMLNDDNSNMIGIKQYLDMMYVGWSRDLKTSITVELMLRSEDDPFYEVYKEKLNEIETEEIMNGN